MDAKYPTISALKAAFASGELNDYQLAVDNDDARLVYVGKVPKGEDRGCYHDQMNDECGDWFRGNGYQDIVKAFNVAGIPADWV